MSPGNLIVRANYLATVVFGSGLALFVAAFMLTNGFGSPTTDWTAIASTLLPTIFLFVLPGARALRRVIVNGTVIPPELVHERPVVAWVVTVAGGLGHFFFVISISVAIDIALLPEWPEDVGGPIVFVNSLALLLYLIALLCGELALVGDGVSDAARAQP
jgi:hypothetical protein